ncbi:MAG: ATP-dependent Lon protease [Candidatus Binatota bacterium]|jgi:ATP-dependent Lon protease|nr:ATP-dependent Lon protease [Candidatus Binatota bacterium]
MESESDDIKEQKFYGFEEDVSGISIPEVLPILPLRGVVIFPSAIVPLLISRGTSLKLVEGALAGERMLGLVAQKNPEEESPPPEGLYARGTAGRILKMLKYPDQSVRILVQGLRRIEISEYVQREPYFTAKVKVLPDAFQDAVDIEAVQAHMVNQFAKFVSMTPYLPDELQVVVMNIKDPGKVSDLVASNLNISLEEKQDLLNTPEVKSRLEKLSAILNREIELLEIGHKIQSQVQSELNKNQKEFYLRQQMKAIQKELGDSDPRSSEIEELRRRIDEAGMPEEPKKAADNELERLRIIPAESAEHTVVRTYLEWLANLPWSKSTEDNLDIPHARGVLDEDHYDLVKIKDRILEYLAVRQLKKDPKGPILCFVGPPGTGKTSLGRSIARAIGRKFQRISLGGVRDEAEIRGHRRTYIGALPGRMIQAIRNAGSNNPLFMLDEIDKLGMDFRGDPASALLEVLDPEQNSTFVDHYLDVPFDLSRIMFITTANYLEPVPPALRDRMEVIELAGYTEEEKLEIARRHLIPKQRTENGLTENDIEFTDDGVHEIIHSYTREAGLRNLEREIGRVCRKVARRITEGNRERVVVTSENVRTFLGPERFFSEVAERLGEPGVATGLAWTPNGGEILFIESTRMPGKKGLTLTGHLGEVMKESAQAALSYIRTRAERFGISADFFDNSDLHVHVPAGAIPKDGPSAGVAMAVSLISLLTGRPVRHDVAMTGEITLRGRVLPVGGVKEKVLGAKRAGIKLVILPMRNEKDLEELADEVRKEMSFVFVETIDDVVRHALEPATEAAAAKAPTEAPDVDTAA